MPFIKTACTALLAAAAFVFAPAASATEIDATAATAATATAPSQSLFSSWFGGRASKVEATAADDGEPAAPRSLAAIGAGHAGDLVVGALGLLGISYRMGGTSPASGFDCSGMVRYVFQNTVGLDLPRRAEEISRVGQHVDRHELKPGDLVFYKTLRKTFSHVGIYLGNNRFIHAPSAGGSVRVDDMSQGYWAARFNGARRVGP